MSFQEVFRHLSCFWEVKMMLKKYYSKEEVKRFYDKIANWYDVSHHLQTLWADTLIEKRLLNMQQ